MVGHTPTNGRNYINKWYQCRKHGTGVTEPAANKCTKCWKTVRFNKKCVNNNIHLEERKVRNQQSFLTMVMVRSSFSIA